MIATVHLNDRTDPVAAALVAGGLAAAGRRPVVAVAADGAQACGLARLAGDFDIVKPESRDLMAVISDVASRSGGDVVALLPTDWVQTAGSACPGRVHVVATGCGL